MVLEFVLIIVATFAVYTDLKYRQIYNYLTFPAIFLGFTSSFYINGLASLNSSLIGFFVGLAILLVPFLLNSMGGGDLKLLAAVGALGGYPFILWAAAYMALIGGAIAITATIRQRRLKRSTSIRSGYASEEPCIFIIEGKNEEAVAQVMLPYGVAIGLGAIVAVFIRI